MIKKILLGMTLLMSMVSCTEDYTDWANPQTNPQEDAVAFGNGSVTPVDVINLADVTEDKVQVASIVAPTSSNAAYTPNYKINFDGQSFDIDADGNMATAELTSYIVDKWGKRPLERDIDATLDAWVSNGSTAVKMATSATFQVKAIPEAPVIEEGYYLVGDMFTTEDVNGWSKAAAKAFKHSDRDVYDDPIFTLTFETKKANQYWKIIPKKNIDADDLWAAGVVGPKVDGDDSMTGLLTNTEAKAGKIAKAGKLPTISANAGISTNNTSMNDSALARQLKTNFNMGAGIGISIPLFENRTTKTQVNKAIIQRESIQLDLKNEQTSLYSTIENYWLQASTNQSQYKAAKASSKSAQTSYNLLSEQFRLGLKNIVELRTGKDNLLMAKQNELQAKYLTILNVNMLKFYRDGRL